MDPFNTNSERVQQDNSETNSAGNLMRGYANRHQIVMIPTPSFNYNAETVQPNTNQTVSNAGTSSVHQSDNQRHHNLVISSPMISNNPPAMSYSNVSTLHASTPTMSSSQALAPCRSLALVESNSPVLIQNSSATLAKSNSQTSEPYGHHSVARSNTQALIANPSHSVTRSNSQFFAPSTSITRSQSQALTPYSSPALAERNSHAFNRNPSLLLARSNSQTSTLNSPLSLARSNLHTLTPNPSLAPARSNSHTSNPSLSLAGSNSQGFTPHNSFALYGSKSQASALHPSLAPVENNSQTSTRYSFPLAESNSQALTPYVSIAPTERNSQPLTSHSSLIPVESNSQSWTQCPPLSNLPVISGSNSQASTTTPPLAENNSPYPPLAKSNPQSLTSMPHQNPLPSPLEAQVNPAPTSAFWPHMDQSSTVFNPSADQRQALATYAPGMNQQLTSLRPYANMPGVLFTENNEAMPGTSINRPHGYLVRTSNNNNGAGLEVPNNAGASSVSGPAVAPADSIFAPTVQAPSQQAVQTNAQPEKAASTVPSIYVQQLRKYLHRWTNRPKNNNIQFWKNFVTEFYAPTGMRKNCWAVFPSLPSTKYSRAKERSSCDHCQNYSLYINDIGFEELAIYNQYKFSSFRDERVKLGLFQEQHLVSTNVVLYFPCAIESVLEGTFWSVRKGPLAITFAANKKILSWQFCMRSCERVPYEPPKALVPKNSLIGASESSSNQQHTQENCISTTQTVFELTKRLETNQSFEIGLGARGTQTNKINGPRNTLILESDFLKQHKLVSDFLSNVDSTAQPTLSSHSQGPSTRFNLQMPQLPNGSSPYVAPTANGSSPQVPSNPHKRAGTTANPLGADAPELRATRQRLQHLSGNGVEFGKGSENIALTEQVTHESCKDISENGVGFGNRSENSALATDLTQSLAAYGNFNSNTNAMVASGADPTEEQMDQFFESLEADGNIVSDDTPMHGFGENTTGQVNQHSEDNDSEDDLIDFCLYYLNQ